jgi:hypothetical protein
MISIIRVFLVVSVSALWGCSYCPAPSSFPDDALEDSPDWVAELVETMQREKVANPPASLWRYSYRGNAVYFVPPRCCDIPSILYDAGGTVICSPDGGIGGGGDGRCPDFFEARSDEALVWQDLRKP